MGPVVSGLLALEVGGVGKNVVLFPHQHMKRSHRSACVAWGILYHVSRSGDTCLQIKGPLSRQVVGLILHRGKMEVAGKASRTHWCGLTQACRTLSSKQVAWALM